MGRTPLIMAVIGDFLEGVLVLLEYGVDQTIRDYVSYLDLFIYISLYLFIDVFIYLFACFRMEYLLIIMLFNFKDLQ